MVALLDGRQPVFGVFAPERSSAGGIAAARQADADFVFYCLEVDPWDMPTLGLFMDGMDQGSGGRRTQAVTLRIPPIREGHASAVERIRDGLVAGVDAFILPHTETPEEVTLATGAIGPRLWPLHAGGDVFTIVQIEDRSAVDRVRDIVSTPGVGVVLPGAKDLKVSYGGDAVAVEDAIQQVLAAANDFGVPCAVTAGAGDVTKRLEQGFRVIIATEQEALGVGRAAIPRRNGHA
jgi:hypothetical protein